MVLFGILLIIAIILTVLAVAALILGGTVGFVLFGDLIVCVALVVWLIRRHWKKHH